MNPQTLADARASFSRRHFLRGLGACFALPAFASLRPLRSFAAEATPAAPVRMAFLYVPNGTIPSAWWPAGEAGKNFVLPPTLAPLEAVRHQLQIISGLDDLNANPGPDGAGDHARAGGTFLTGVRIRKTSGSDVYAGTSIDQVVAGQIGHLTRFPSLELTCDSVRKAGNCDSGYSCAYQYNLSWKSLDPILPSRPNQIPGSSSSASSAAANRAERAASLQHRQAQQQLHPRLRPR